MTTIAIRRHARVASGDGALDGDRHQPVPVRRIVAERTPGEIAPQVEVFELETRGRLESCP